MDSILTIALSYLLLYKYLAFFVLIFLGAFILPLPDNLILLATGAFASQGYFSLTAVFILALVTTMTSDILGYFLTRRFEMSVLKFLRIPERHIKTAHHYVEDYTGMTIFITRLAGPFGPAVNFISGLIGVQWHTFVLYDFLGNFVDVVVFLVAGYLLGNYWLVYSDQISIIVASIGTIVLLVFVVVRLWKKKDIA